MVDSNAVEGEKMESDREGLCMYRRYIIIEERGKREMV